MTNKYCELGWLSQKDGLTLPTVIFTGEEQDCSGFYVVPEKDSYMEFEGKEYDTDNGIIVIPYVNQSYGDLIYENEEILHTLAHEYRHHWQHYNYGNIISEDKVTEGTYLDGQYFYYQQFFELDAMMFAQKISPSRFTSLVLKYIESVNKKKDNERQTLNKLFIDFEKRA